MAAIFGGGSGNQPNKEFGARVNQSVLGYPIPVVMGTAQVQQSLLWMDGFKSIKESATSGGKGGGGKSGTFYNYTINVVSGLCNGPITAIGDVWSGQSWLGNPKAFESYTITGTGIYTPANASALVNDLGAGVNTTYSGTFSDYGAPSSTVLSGTDTTPLQKIAYGTTPATGQYSVDPSTGNYHFNTATDTGKTVQIPYSFTLTNINQQETDVIPAGKTISVGGSNPFASDLGVVYATGVNEGVALTRVSGTPTVTGTYSASGSAPATYKFATGDINAEVTITYSITDTSAVGQGQPTILNYTLNVGTQGQSPYAFLTASYPGVAFGYTNIATVLCQPMQLGTSAEVQQNKFEIITPDVYGAGIPDCNPVQCVGQVLTNSVWGLGVGPVPFPVSVIDDGVSGTWGSPAGTGGTRTTAATAWNWFAAQNFFISPVIDTQDTAASVASKWLEAGMCAAFMSEGLLKLVPYGDTSAAANGCTWTAPASYVVALDDSCVIAKDGEDPFKMTRTSPADAWNSVQVQWDNRSNQYSPETTKETDQSSINRWGERIEDPQDWDFIHTLNAATFAANMRVKRSVYIRRNFEFTLPYSYSYLEPMDIVTISTTSVWAQGLNNANLSITNLPVRITRIVDDPKEGLQITAEEYPWGAHLPVLYNKQISAGDVAANAFADPGNSEVILFEATDELTKFAGDQIWIGALGTSDTWGSCNIWVSSDGGTTYEQVGTINTPARLGELASTFTTGTDPDTTHSLVVDLAENCAALDAGSSGDADNFNTLCFIGDNTNEEVIAYSTLTSTGQNQITMSSYIRRGLFGTTPHTFSSGALFMRLDTNVFKYTYDPQWRGKTLDFKFQSVNAFGNNAQELSSLTPVSFTIPGDNPGSIDAATGLVIDIGEQIFLGAWSSSTTYAQGVFVDYNGVIYVSLQNANLNETPSSSPTWWLTAGSVAWQGVWSSSTTYKLGDLVSYLNLIYVSLINSNLNHIPSSSPSDWQLTGTASQFMGNWSSSTAYVVGAQVIDVAGGGGYYICIANNTNVQPSTNGLDWQLITAGNLTAFVGNYSGATAYKVGQVVEYQGSQWVCISATTGNAPSTTSSFWTLLGSNALFMGTWSSSTAYTQNMTVLYSGNFYQAVQANTNQTPSQTSSTYWQLTGPNTLDSLEDGTIYIKGIQYESQTIVVPNSNFEASSSLPVPGWLPSGATLSYETSTPYAGNQSLKITTAGQYNAAVSVQHWAVNPGDQFFVSSAMKSDGTGNPDTQFVFLDKTGGYNGGVGSSSGLGTSWAITTNSGTAPAGTVSAYLSLQNDASGGSGTCWFDSISVTKLIDPTSQIVAVGSTPNTTGGTLTYTSTSSSITIIWAGLTLFRADGTTTIVPNGSQAITGLSASTTYYFYVFWSEKLQSVQFVSASIVPGLIKVTGVEFTASTSGYVSTTTSSTPSTSSGSIEYWVNFTSAGNGTFVNHSDAQTGSPTTTNIFTGGNSGNIQFGVRASGGTITPVLNSALTYNDGRWHHVACTWSGTTGQIYVDGALSISGTIATESFVSGYWRISSNQSAVLHNSVLNETIANVAIYNGTVLSAITIEADYLAMVNGSQAAYETVILGNAGLTYFWNLTEASGTSAAESKASNTGTYQATYTLNQTSAIAPVVGSPAYAWETQSYSLAQVQGLQSNVPLSAGAMALATTSGGSTGGGESGGAGGGKHYY